MRTHVFLEALLVGACLAVALPGESPGGDLSAAQAQATSEPRGELWLSAGGAWTTAGVFGGVHEVDRRVAILEVGLTRRLTVKQKVVVEYQASVVPVELQTGTTLANPPGAHPATRVGTVYGAGLQPLGINVRARSGRWLPVAGVNTGFRIFADAVPNPRASHFNFVVDLGLGVLKRIEGTHWLSVGLALHHVSNANLADSNPGVNQFVVSVGLARLR